MPVWRAGAHGISTPGIVMFVLVFPRGLHLALLSLSLGSSLLGVTCTLRVPFLVSFSRCVCVVPFLFV